MTYPGIMTTILTSPPKEIFWWGDKWKGSTSHTFFCLKKLWVFLVVLLTVEVVLQQSADSFPGAGLQLRTC